MTTKANEKTEFERLIDNVMQGIAHFEYKIQVEDNEYRTAENKETATLVIAEDYPVWTSTLLKEIIKILGDKAHFTLCTSVIDSKTKLFIIAR